MFLLHNNYAHNEGLKNKGLRFRFTNHAHAHVATSRHVARCHCTSRPSAMSRFTQLHNCQLVTMRPLLKSQAAACFILLLPSKNKMS